uniref:Protein disulfide isomerase like, testis expressed n=1 Tax=Taeniopygia guttata TaxID=59729 RepID=H0ZG74_TAEGU
FVIFMLWCVCVCACAVIYLNVCIHKNTHLYTKEQTPFYETKFDSSHCGLCNPFNLSEEFAEAAQQLKKEAPRIQFGKIDVTHQHDLRKEFNIQAFPTVKFFVNGSREDPTDCKGVRKASTFITWVKRRTGPSAVLINSTDQAEAIIKTDDLAVIGFFRVIIWKTQKAARDVPEMPFGMTVSEDVCANYGVQRNSLIVFKKVGVQNGADVESFISQTSVKIFDVPVENHILLFTPMNSEPFNEIYENYQSAAAEFRGKILFVLVDTNEARNGRIFEYFRIRDIDVPAVRILNLTSDARYKMPADEVTVENLKEFCQNYLNGKAKQHLPSEEIPQDWDKMPVKVLVGKNFNSIIFFHPYLTPTTFSQKIAILDHLKNFNSTEKDSQDCEESFLEGAHWKNDSSQVNTELNKKNKSKEFSTHGFLCVTSLLNPI